VDFFDLRYLYSYDDDKCIKKSFFLEKISVDNLYILGAYEATFKKLGGQGLSTFKNLSK